MEKLLEEVANELNRARTLHPRGFNSCHEGYAVIWEEMDELWDEVKKKKKERSLRDMRGECIQVAAMAMRFIEDLIDKENKGTF